MPRRKYYPVPIVEIRRILNNSMLSPSPPIRRKTISVRTIADDIEELDSNIRHNLGLGEAKRKSNNMLFFVMYDIESDKVRTQVVKYLQRQGCLRVQKSIFLADLPCDKMDTIMADLTEVQACYENHDSIMVVPISAEYLQAMRVIGKKINMDIIMKTKNTLFF